MTTSPEKPVVRYHDMDALRAVAMILGIALHGALSFVPFPWGVQDTEKHEAFGTFFWAIHGFRMPVFFVMSGFFTAMLWRRRGLGSILKQRFLRVFLPCMVGIWTICPLQNLVGAFVYTESPPEWPFEVEVEDEGAPIVAEVERAERLPLAAKLGQADVVRAFLGEGADPEERMEDGSSALHWAAVQGHYEIVEALLDADADIGVRSGDGGTPLHWAVFLGELEMVELLLAEGADPNTRNNEGKSPLDTVSASWKDLEEITKWIAGLMQIEVDLEQIEEDRPAVIAALDAAGAEGGGDGVGGGDGGDLGRWIWSLFTVNVFHHLWFLWFLCFLVVAFGMYALFADVIGLKRFPRVLINSPLRYLWLLPVTLIPQLMMRGGEVGGFGPDTSTGWLPFPHLLFYYAIFFFFGVLYFDTKEEDDRLGSWWWLTLPLALFVVFPLATGFLLGDSWSQEEGFFKDAQHLIGCCLEVLYVWLMIFGLMGLFRKLCRRESRVMRYVSDSSYWLYLMHLPLIMLGQWCVRDWPLSPFIKFPFVCGVVTGLLLLSYQLIVRYTPIGTFLNGKRLRVQGER